MRCLTMSATRLSTLTGSTAPGAKCSLGGRDGICDKMRKDGKSEEGWEKDGRKDEKDDGIEKVRMDGRKDGRREVIENVAEELGQVSGVVRESRK